MPAIHAKAAIKCAAFMYRYRLLMKFIKLFMTGHSKLRAIKLPRGQDELAV